MRGLGAKNGKFGKLKSWNRYKSGSISRDIKQIRSIPSIKNLVSPKEETEEDTWWGKVSGGGGCKTWDYTDILK